MKVEVTIMDAEFLMRKRKDWLVSAIEDAARGLQEPPQALDGLRKRDLAKLLLHMQAKLAARAKRAKDARLGE